MWQISTPIREYPKIDPYTTSSGKLKRCGCGLFMTAIIIFMGIRIRITQVQCLRHLARKVCSGAASDTWTSNVMFSRYATHFGSAGVSHERSIPLTSACHWILNIFLTWRIWKILYNFLISNLIYSTNRKWKKINFSLLHFYSSLVCGWCCCCLLHIFSACSMSDYRMTHDPSCWYSFSHANGIWSCQNFSLPCKVAKRILSSSQSWRR